MRKGAAFTVYIDGEGLVKLANDAVAKDAPPDRARPGRRRGTCWRSMECDG